MSRKSPECSINHWCTPPRGLYTCPLTRNRRLRRSFKQRAIVYTDALSSLVKRMSVVIIRILFFVTHTYMEKKKECTDSLEVILKGYRGESRLLFMEENKVTILPTSKMSRGLICLLSHHLGTSGIKSTTLVRGKNCRQNKQATLLSRHGTRITLTRSSTAKL